MIDKIKRVLSEWYYGKAGYMEIGERKMFYPDRHWTSWKFHKVLGFLREDPKWTIGIIVAIVGLLFTVL